jgi:hypothetical protein
MTITSSIPMLFFLALAALSVGVRTVEGTTMEDKIRRKIEEAAAKEYGWKMNEVRVDEVERLRRPSCSFYTVAHTVRPLSYQGNYALLGGEQVVGTGDGDVVAKILDSCSAGAPAEWWAEIVTRFHRDLGSGIVLRDENTRPDVVRKLKEAGKAFAAPALDNGKMPLRYLLLNPETYTLYRIEATRSAGGAVEVSKSKVL